MRKRFEVIEGGNKKPPRQADAKTRGAQKRGVRMGSLFHELTQGILARAGKPPATSLLSPVPISQAKQAELDKTAAKMRDFLAETSSIDRELGAMDRKKLRKVLKDLEEK